MTDTITNYRIARELCIAREQVKWEEDGWGFNATIDNYSLMVTWDFGVYYYAIARDKKKVFEGAQATEELAKQTAIKAYVNHLLNIK